jgi:hypothetical protein
MSAFDPKRTFSVLPGAVMGHAVEARIERRLAAILAGGVARLAKLLVKFEAGVLCA